MRVLRERNIPAESPELGAVVVGIITPEAREAGEGIISHIRDIATPLIWKRSGQEYYLVNLYTMDSALLTI
jgi:hypothetical protein